MGLDNMKITIDDTVESAFIKMMESNPGAGSALGELLKLEKGLTAMFHLDEMNIRGWKIWVAYKDHCKMDVNFFYDCIMCKDERMLARIAKEEAAMQLSDKYL